MADDTSSAEANGTIYTELIVIRHGQTIWNTERRMQGHTNTALSDLGRAQARALAERMRTETFNHLYSSDLSRAHDTAIAIASVTGHSIRLDPRLRERGFGIFEGLNRTDMQERHPDEYARFSERDPDYAVPGGESPRAFFERSLSCFEELVERHRGERIVVVAHGLLLDTLYRAAHGLGLGKRHQLDLTNASLNIFRHADGRWEIIAWADSEHLKAVPGHPGPGY